MDPVRDTICASVWPPELITVESLDGIANDAEYKPGRPAEVVLPVCCEAVTYLMYDPDRIVTKRQFVPPMLVSALPETRFVSCPLW
jgi:hypothetical protein